MESVYVLSANTTRTISGVRTFGPGNDKEYYFLPNDYETPDKEGFAYCEVTKNGSYAYELEVGAAVTLIIWDGDKSFIDAITRLLGVFRRIIYYSSLSGGNIPDDVLREGISVLT